MTAFPNDERFDQDVQDGEKISKLGKKHFEETISSKINEDDGVEETHINYVPMIASPMFFGGVGKKHEEIDWTK